VFRPNRITQKEFFLQKTTRLGDGDSDDDDGGDGCGGD
jgi:hypothetical protein